MSMLSPAERFIRITLSCSSSRICAMVRTLRSSSTSTSIGTSATWAISSSGVTGAPYLLLQVDGVLAQLIDRRHHFTVRLISALQNDEIGELLCDINVGGLHRPAHHRSPSTGSRHAD